MMKLSNTKATSIVVFFLVVCCSIGRGVSGLAAVNRKAFFKNIGGVAAAAATGAAVVAFNAPLPAEAFDPQTFNHQYTDPKHPNCKRIVVVKKDGIAAISGTDGTPGCPEDGSGDVWRLVGEVEDDTILVDFTPKVNKIGSPSTKKKNPSDGTHNMIF